mmetsp:Transcript_152902/g.267193  ORF Transcript_152902/g.267193 Transcript_152902/m.267193 type:complete len:409 (-) Transcript_152902:362-1588(-)
MGACCTPQLQVIDIHSAAGAISYEFPRDALRPNRGLEASIDELRDHVFLKKLEIILTFLGPHPEARNSHARETILRIINALHSCDSLVHLELHVYVPDLEPGGDPLATVSALFSGLDREKLETLIVTYRREVPSLNNLCLDDFLFRHCNLKTLHFGGAASSGRFDEMPASLLDSICALPHLSNLTVCAIGSQRGSKTVQHLVQAVMDSPKCVLKRLELKRQHASDYGAVESNLKWHVRRTNLSTAILERTVPRGARGPIRPQYLKQVAGPQVALHPSTQVSAYLQPQVAIFERIEPAELSISAGKLSVSHIGPDGSLNSVSHVIGLDPTAECYVCLNEPRQVCFVPCGHCICCSACAPRMHECALCGGPVHSVTSPRQQGALPPEMQHSDDSQTFGPQRNPLVPPVLV